MLEDLGPVMVRSQAVLDIAPSPQITRVLRRLAPFIVRMDLDPAADRRLIDVQASLCRTPFRDGAFDVVICYHVLEHVPDDTAAMRELARLLSPGGLGFVQVPWRSRTTTDEDPNASVEERIRRFGQADHVRHYGIDFDNRLRGAGLNPWRFMVEDMLSPELIECFRLTASESVWIIQHAIGTLRTPTVTPETLRLILARPSAVFPKIGLSFDPSEHARGN